MTIQKFESYSEDEGILQDIFSELEDSFDVEIEVKKTFLSLKWLGPLWDGWSGNPSFYDLFNESPFGWDITTNVSRLFPDSEIIDIRRRASVGYAYRNIPFYIVSITYEEGKWARGSIKDGSKPLCDLSKEFGFLQVYDSYSKFRRGNYIRQILVFYHESYVGC